MNARYTVDPRGLILEPSALPTEAELDLAQLQLEWLVSPVRQLMERSRRQALEAARWSSLP